MQSPNASAGRLCSLSDECVTKQSQVIRKFHELCRKGVAAQAVCLHLSVLIALSPDHRIRRHRREQSDLERCFAEL